jgi:hypothetical protein
MPAWRDAARQDEYRNVFPVVKAGPGVSAWCTLIIEKQFYNQLSEVITRTTWPDNLRTAAFVGGVQMTAIPSKADVDRALLIQPDLERSEPTAYSDH